jgi:hypothetical protein
MGALEGTDNTSFIPLSLLGLRPYHLPVLALNKGNTLPSKIKTKSAEKQEGEARGRVVCGGHIYGGKEGEKK